MIGITGTKGKSTVVELIAYILEKAGKKAVVSSSVRNELSGMTMPGRFFMQNLLRRGVRDHAEYAVIEVTSQGVIQSRHRFISWNVAAFTNLAPEHVEAHGGFEKYRDAKVSFFRYVAKNPQARFIINKDDANAQYFIDAVNLLQSDFNRIVLYGISDLPCLLLGEFNQYNVGAAVAATEAVGISHDVIRRAVADFPGVHGRMEFIQKEPFAVLVDYAVTPDSLEAVYQTLKNLSFMNHDSRLITVFGCTGGGRDTGKRSVMGGIAARYCDEIILTDDDSYDERPEDIIADIRRGCDTIQDPSLCQLTDTGGQAGFRIQEYVDRKEAIRKALSLAQPGDMVVITGKGGDRWLRKAQGKKIPWSDSQAVRDILQEMQNAKFKNQN